VARVLITTVPFADQNKLPFELLDSVGAEYIVNPFGRRLQEAELVEMITDFEILIAGTEQITENVINNAKKLKFISRVGIGLDNVDLLAAKRRNIQVSYTPDAPAPAVAEFTIALILSLLRSVHISNSQMHKGEWQRHFGRRIPEITIGIIGAGRIGGRVLRRIQSFGSPRILINDLNPQDNIAPDLKLEWVGKDEIYKNADVISLHIPLTVKTKNMIGFKELMMMKSDAIIVNTSRGGIVNEEDLANVLNSGHLSGAAIDVFGKEPYIGKLSEIERCLLTAHMGSMSLDCRSRMEIEATEEVIRFITGQKLEQLVPPTEYDIQKK
jgi:D-3-phosphoglycerate dehydrogenase